MKKLAIILCIFMLLNVLFVSCANNNDEINILRTELEELKSEKISAEEQLAIENTYEQAIINVVLSMKIQSAIYEFTHYGISSVWSFAIDNGLDFNIQINAFLDLIRDDPNCAGAYSLDDIATMMIEIQNPPDKFKSAYMAVVELYETYVQMAEQATNPSGSLITYNKKTKDLSTKFNSTYAKIKILLPKIENQDSVSEV